MLVRSELEDPLRAGEVLEPVLPEIAQAVRGGQGRRRRRHEDLAAVARRGNPCRAVDVAADVALGRQVRRPGVDAHPHADGTGREGLLALPRGVDRALGRPEGDKERIALVVDLDAAVARAGVAQDPPVLREGISVRRRTQLVEEPGRSLDVGEQERDRA
jgi:hypothetical protein